MSNILIIEDDLDIAQLQKDYIEINNMNAVVFNDGLKGLEAALNEKFNLIILDIMLPSMSGFEICKILRSKLDIPIILISAKKEDFDKVRGLGLGADDYLTKPFSPNELIARINAHLARYNRLAGPQNDEGIIIKKHIKLDKNSHRVYYFDQEINITTKEYELLNFFMSNENHIFTKDELFERIWGLDSFGESSTVIMHIKRLRSKVELDAKNPQLIETVWGSGYRFNTK